MNPIDQMMECYGVEKRVYCELTCKNRTLCNANCEHYNEAILYHLPFTAKKQIELIKYIMEASNTDELRMYYSEILKCYVFYWFSLPELDVRDSYSTQNTNYDFALAELVTVLEKELDHQRVKEILEG